MAEILSELQLQHVQTKAQLKVAIKQLVQTRITALKAERISHKTRVAELSRQIKNESKKRARLLSYADCSHFAAGGGLAAPNAAPVGGGGGVADPNAGEAAAIDPNAGDGDGDVADPNAGEAGVIDPNAGEGVADPNAGEA